MTCRESMLSPDDELVRVPLSACITADTLESLAERLAYERDKGQKSRFAPYIDILPTFHIMSDDDDRPSLSSLPRFWNANRLEKITDGGQLQDRMQNDERKEVGKKGMIGITCLASISKYWIHRHHLLSPMQIRGHSHVSIPEPTSLVTGIR